MLSSSLPASLPACGSLLPCLANGGAEGISPPPSDKPALANLAACACACAYAMAFSLGAGFKLLPGKSLFLNTLRGDAAPPLVPKDGTGELPPSD